MHVITAWKCRVKQIDCISSMQDSTPTQKKERKLQMRLENVLSVGNDPEFFGAIKQVKRSPTCHNCGLTGKNHVCYITLPVSIQYSTECIGNVQTHSAHTILLICSRKSWDSSWVALCVGVSGSLTSTSCLIKGLYYCSAVIYTATP